MRHHAIFRQRDDDGQNKLPQINGSEDNSWYIINRMNLITVLKLENMGFMFGKNSAKPCSLKMYLFRLARHPLYQDS